MKATLSCCKNKLSEYKYIKLYIYKRYFVTYFSKSVISVCLSNFSVTVNIIYREMEESGKLTP
jgi:hypothetical protein